VYFKGRNHLRAKMGESYYWILKEWGLKNLGEDV
jgi:hypothetical protein